MKKVLVLSVMVLMLVGTVGFAGPPDYSNAPDHAGSPDKAGPTEKDVVNLDVSNDDIKIKSNGFSKYIDIIATYNDGFSKDVTHDVNWESKDKSVAVSFDGRILGQGKGSTTIKVSYGNIKEKINVEVLNEKDLLEKAKTKQENIAALQNASRQEITSKGYDMIHVYWNPTEELVGWRGNYTFEESSNPYYPYGIPYSQTPNQVDEKDFIYALNNEDDFYDTLTNPIQPRYGSDCSGFLSFAWGLSRKTTYDFVEGIRDGTYSKVGSYDSYNPSRADLMNSYPLMQSGDAVVYRSGGVGHTFLIASNNVSNEYVMAYEQTPYHSQTTFHTYDDLANLYYMPFFRD